MLKVFLHRGDVDARTDDEHALRRRVLASTAAAISVSTPIASALCRLC